MRPRGLGSKLTCIDLFAGVGGLSTGLTWAGFQIVYANEVVPSHAQALSLSHPDTEVELGDIRSVDPKKVRRRLGLAKGELSLLAGGPPCQGFSINAPARSTEDERNSLFLNYLAFVKEFSPQSVLIENVPGMLSFNSGQVVRDILTALASLGYKAAVRILYAAHYGVPQMRWRTVFLGTRENIDPASLFPSPTHTAPTRANFGSRLDGSSLLVSPDVVKKYAKRGHVTVEEAISDLPPIPNGEGEEMAKYASSPLSDYQRELRKGCKVVFNHRCAGIGRNNLERISHIPPGGSWRDIPFDLLPAGMKRARRSDHTKRYGRLDPNSLGSTILTKCDPHWGTYIHYSQDRVLSVREAARIQSFPDRIQFVGSLSEQYEQVGNAVPPLFARTIGKAICKTLAPYSKDASDETSEALSIAV